MHHNYNCKLENCFLVALQTRALKVPLCSEANDFSPSLHKNYSCVKSHTVFGKTRFEFIRADAWNLRLAKPRLDRHSYTSGGLRDSQMSVGLYVGWNKHQVSWNWLLQDKGGPTAKYLWRTGSVRCVTGPLPCALHGNVRAYKVVVAALFTSGTVLTSTSPP